MPRKTHSGDVTDMSEVHYIFQSSSSDTTTFPPKLDSTPGQTSLKIKSCICNFTYEGEERKSKIICTNTHTCQINTGLIKSWSTGWLWGRVCDSKRFNRVKNSRLLCDLQSFDLVIHAEIMWGEGDSTGYTGHIGCTVPMSSGSCCIAVERREGRVSLRNYNNHVKHLLIVGNSLKHTRLFLKAVHDSL